MEAGRLVGEDADLEPVGSVFRKVEKAGERVRFRGLEVVRGEQPDPNSTIECILQIVAEEGEPRPHHEAHDQINAVEPGILQTVAKRLEDAALLVV